MKDLRNKKRIVWFMLTIAIIIVIFFFSSQSGENSYAISNAVAEKINIQPQKEWEEASNVSLALGFNIRKWAHIVLYAALGYTTVMWICSWWRAGLICYGYACFDELHQLFVGSRGASVNDTFLDALGFGVVILVWLSISSLTNKQND